MSSVTAVPEAPSAAVLDDPAELAGYTRFDTSPDGSRRAQSTLLLSGMHCAACAGLIEQALLRAGGAEEATVNAASQRATVRWDPQRTQPSRLVAAVQAAGYGAAPDLAAPARELRRVEHRRALWQLFVAAFCAMQVMMLATPSYVAGPGELSADMRQLLNWGQWVLSLPVLLFATGPFFGGAWRALRQRRIGMDLPVALGVGVTFVASSGATFDPAGLFGSDVFFDSMTMFVSFLLGGRYLELRARHRAAEALEGALATLPRTAWRVLDALNTQVECISVQRLRVGDRLRVPVGEAFPADGTLLEGATEVDESLLSGESLPVPKRPGAAVVGGSLNRGAPVLMRVERCGTDTRFEAIAALMRGAAGQRPALAAVADRWAAPFLWTVLLLAAGAGALWSVIDPSRALWVVVSVLIVTCPCALSLAVPSTLVAAAAGLARRGVLLRRLDALETLARVQHLFIDKTGTLTEAQPGLAGMQQQPGALLGEADLRGWSASLAGWSSHPLSQALVRAFPATAGLQWQQVRELPGCGVQALDAQGRCWRLGARRWACAEAVPSAADAKEDAGAGPRVWLACDGRAQAVFRFGEVLREGAAQALAALQEQGLRITLLSGDMPARAQALAASLGLSQVIGGATPEDKLAAVAAAQAAGEVVAMVGDGINDAPVLARADVSLAMGQGALISRSQADAVLVANRPQDLVRARATAQRAMAIVRQNLWWAALYNAACVPLALAGWLPPWAAGLGMASSSLLVILNSLRAAR